MIVAGFDPGKSGGWAVLEILAQGRSVTWRACGVLEGPEQLHQARELLSQHRPQLVGIEKVARVFPKEGFGLQMAGHLLDAAWLGGELKATAELRLEARVETFQAAEWRRALVGHPQATNAQISQWARLRLKGWPARSNNHERDAGGVALFAYERVRLAGMT